MAFFTRLSDQDVEAVNLIIHVIPAYPVEELDEGDLDDAGNCIVDGRYRLGLRFSNGTPSDIRSIALDAFNAFCGVFEPAFFTFMVSTFNPAMDRSIRRNIGVYNVTMEDCDGGSIHRLRVVGVDTVPQNIQKVG